MEYAPGLPNKKIKEVPRISESQEWRMAIQKHDAKRAGTHYDLRIVDDKTGKAYSWAVRHLPTNPGDKTLAKLQPTHTAAYSTWSGTIAEGYGAGKVQLFAQDKIEVLKADLEHITFNVYKSNGDTERYALINTGDDNWLFTNTTPTRKTRPFIPAEKPSYKSENIEKLDPNNPNQVWSPKIDGALNAFLLNKGKNIESYSYRPSAKSANKLIDHTYRLPHYKIPSPMNIPGHTVVLGEVYAADHEGNALPVTDTTSRLLSNVWKSRELQKSAPLQTRIFNVLTYKGKDVSTKPYSEKLEILKHIAASTPGLKLPPLATTPEQKIEMLKQIRSGNHPLSREGIAIYNLDQDTPTKAKVQEDYDVHIRDIYEGEEGLKGKAAGGFTFSYLPEGPIAGRVGGGFDAATRVDMWQHPEKYKGQVARVFAQQKLPSGALRMPIFKDLRPELWKKGSTSDEILKYLRDNKTRFVIGGSYGLRHIRDPKDIDINVHPGDFNKLKSLGNEKITTSGDKYISVPTSDKPLEIWEDWNPREFNYRSLVSKGFVKDEHGNPTWTLSQTKAWKKTMGREKDLADLELLKKHAVLRKHLPPVAKKKDWNDPRDMNPNTGSLFYKAMENIKDTDASKEQIEPMNKDADLKANKDVVIKFNKLYDKPIPKEFPDDWDPRKLYLSKYSHITEVHSVEEAKAKGMPYQGITRLERAIKHGYTGMFIEQPHRKQEQFIYIDPTRIGMGVERPLRRHELMHYVDRMNNHWSVPDKGNRVGDAVRGAVREYRAQKYGYLNTPITKAWPTHRRLAEYLYPVEKGLGRLLNHPVKLKMLKTLLTKRAELSKLAYVQKIKGKYWVRSEKGKNLGGPYDTPEEASHRLQQVEYFKRHKS